ncbi:MAG: glycosyltransferase family 2 protein, partial [Candidatus Dormibacteraceae bacterium]
YVNSFEDVDLCLNVKRDGGRVVYAPTSVAYHWESMTEDRIGPSDMRNYDLFMERWGDVFDQDLPGLLNQTENAGYDLGDRLPSRREVIDRQARLEKWGDRINEMEKHEIEVEFRLRQVKKQQAEVDRLRHIAGMRSVKAAVWARNTFRSIIPAQNES